MTVSFWFIILYLSRTTENYILVLVAIKTIRKMEIITVHESIKCINALIGDSP